MKVGAARPSTIATCDATARRRREGGGSWEGERAVARRTVATDVGSQPAVWKSAGSASMPGPVTLFATSTTCETKKIPAGRSASERAPAAVEKGGEKESAIVVVDTTTPDDETTKDETATL